MSELAFNLNGDAFDVPTNAVGWRVRKMKSKGAPEVAYGRNGQPLVLPIEADVDDLRAEVNAPGRYRLDPIDDENKTIAGASAGYVMVHELAPVAPSIAAQTPPLVPLPDPSNNVVLEAIRMNAEVARMCLDRFPLMMEAAASVLRAADGAGLPAREPRAVGEHDEDDGEFEDDEPTTPKSDLSGLLAQLGKLASIAAPLLAAFGKGGGPSIAEALDWRKAAEAATAEAQPKAKKAIKAPRPDGPGDAAQASPTERAPENVADVLATIGPDAMAHFLAVQNALTADEAAIAREVAKDLSPAEQAAWLVDLKKLSVSDAVAKVRGLIGGTAKTEGVS